MTEAFQVGDILKVKPEWLSPAEKADPKYAELEYYVKDCVGNRVTVVCKSNTFVGYSTYTWPAETMYKVGHLDIEKFLGGRN